MNSVENLLSCSDNLIIQHNHQNRLKGLFWLTLGTILPSNALMLTANTASIVALPTIVMANNYYMPAPVTAAIEALVYGTSAVVMGYLTIMCIGYCFRNMIYHFGPEYQIVKR